MANSTETRPPVPQRRTSLPYSAATVFGSQGPPIPARTAHLSSRNMRSDGGGGDRNVYVSNGKRFPKQISVPAAELYSRGWPAAGAGSPRLVRKIGREIEEATGKEAVCELHPDHCYVYDSVTLLIDIPAAAGHRLVELTCRVTFCGKMSQRCETVTGFRRNHDYGIKTCTPVWYEKESLTVTVKSESGQVLGLGFMEVLDRYATDGRLPAVVINVQQIDNWCSAKFIREVVAAFVPVSQLKQLLSGGMSLLSVFVWCARSETVATEFLDRVLAFALVNGLPPGVSLIDMFSDLPDLRRVMEASVYARGSLHTLQTTVHTQSKHQFIKDQISWLVAKANVTMGSDISVRQYDHLDKRRFSWADDHSLSETEGFYGDRSCQGIGGSSTSPCLASCSAVQSIYHGTRRTLSVDDAYGGLQSLSINPSKPRQFGEVSKLVPHDDGGYVRMSSVPTTAWGSSTSALLKNESCDEDEAPASVFIDSDSEDAICDKGYTFIDPVVVQSTLKTERVSDIDEDDDDDDHHYAKIDPND